MVRPGTPIVFDVNVLIDAVHSTSRRRESALRALTDDSGFVPYTSSAILRTLSFKLLEFGVSQEKVEEYVGFLLDREDGLGFRSIEDIVVRDRGIRDRHGAADFEDAVVACSIEAVEHLTGHKALFVTSDIGFLDWAAQNDQAALAPHSLTQWTRGKSHPSKLRSLQYLSEHMPPLDTTRGLRQRAKAHEIVARSLEEQQNRQHQPTHTARPPHPLPPRRSAEPARPAPDDSEPEL